MLKKLGLPTLALVAMLTLISPPAASARVRVGVTVGSPYYYTYPAYPSPYVYSYPYYYSYPRSVYVYPSWHRHRYHSYYYRHWR
jgi:hypothetical protein